MINVRVVRHVMLNRRSRVNVLWEDLRVLSLIRVHALLMEQIMDPVIVLVVVVRLPVVRADVK